RLLQRLSELPLLPYTTLFRSGRGCSRRTPAAYLLVLGADYPFCPVRFATASSACADRLLISQADIVAHLFRLRVATPRCILLHWKTNLSLSSAVVRPACWLRK